MSAVDIPPGIGLEGSSIARFTAPRRTRRLAYASLTVTIIFGALTWWGVARHPYGRGASTLVVLPFTMALIAALGVAVRLASVRIGRDGVRWGWRLAGVRQEAERIVEVRLYDDGATLRSKRGHWFLAARDWDRFETMSRALTASGLPVTTYPGAAPWRHRLQSYGRVLDGLLILAALIQLVLSTLPR